MKRGSGTWLFLIFIFVLALSFISAESISEDLHLNIQTTNSTGGILTGTYAFVFNISTTSDCSNVVYSNSTSLTTDSRGIISYYLPNVSLDYDQKYYLCYYRDGDLKDSSQITRTPYSFRARNITLSGVEVDENLDMGSYNVSTTGTGFFNFLGSLANKITKLFVMDLDFNGTINGSGNITTTGNITADYFFGDGSQLTNVNGSTQWITSGSNIYYTAGRVGIGTDTPQNELNVLGDGNFTGNVTFGTSSGNILSGALATSAALLNEPSSSTNPTIVPSKSALGYGLGYGSSSLHLIVDESSIIEITSSLVNLTQNTTIGGKLFSGSVAGSGGIINVQSSSSVPTLLPNKDQVDYGLGYGSSSVHLIAAGDNVLEATSSGLTSWKNLIVQGNISVSYNFSVNTSDLFVDSANGNVGIGTVSPTGRFEIYTESSAGENNLLKFSVKDGLSTYNLLDFIFDNSMTDKAIIRMGDSLGTQYDLDFQKYNDDSLLYLDSSTARVGINTTTPQNELNVIGDINATGLIYGNGSQLTDISFTETDPLAYNGTLRFTNNHTFNGDINVIGTFNGSEWLSQQGNLGLDLTDDGSDLILHGDVGGINRLVLETDGAFFELFANPGPANDDLLASITETQGDDTEINFYEGGVGNNRFYDSGSARFGGNSGSTCAELTSDVDCDTSGTGADLVVQDDGWFGGKLFSSDWTNVSITESQISDLQTYRLLSNLTFNGNTIVNGNLSVDSSTLFVNSNTDLVGIGTAAPHNLLELKNSTAMSGGSEPGIDFYSTVNSGASGAYSSGRIYTNFDSDLYTGARLTLAYPTGAGTFADGLSLINGNVGIGTTSPSATLQVKSSGTINENLLWIDSSDGLRAVFATDGSDNGYLTLYNGSTSSTTKINSQGSSYLNGGNVGVGTASPKSDLQIGDYTSLDEPIATISNFGSNVYYSGGYKYTNSDYASMLQQVDGGFKFRTASSGTADNTISFTDVMTIEQGGNVGIGTTALSKLMIYNGADASDIVRIFGGVDDGVGLYMGANDSSDYASIYGWDVNQAGAEQYAGLSVGSSDGSQGIFIDSDGNVGIGTTTPNQKLHVEGNIDLDINDIMWRNRADEGIFEDNYGFIFQAPNAITINFDSNSNDATNYFRVVHDDSVEMFRVDETGVGIGTTTPQNELNVIGDGNFTTGVTIPNSQTYKMGGDDFIKYWATNESIAIGKGAGSNTLYSSVLGDNAGYLNTGTYQTAIGHGAGGSSNSGNSQIAIGYNAGSGNDGNSQIAIGSYAGLSNEGENVIGIGYQATGYNTGDNVIAIGYQAGESNVADNQFILKQASVKSVPLIQGNFSSGHVGIGTSSPSVTLEVNGAITSGQTTCSSSTDSLNVANVNSVLVDTSGGSVTIGGLSGGVAGQVVYLLKVNSANSLIVEHNEATGTQKIYTSTGADLSYATYRGTTMVCNGTTWFQAVF